MLADTDNPYNTTSQNLVTDLELIQQGQEVESMAAPITPEVWAIGGKPVLTTLLVESLLSIEQLPRETDIYTGTHHLSEEAKRSVSSVETIIRSSSEYDTEAYEKAKVQTNPHGPGNFQDDLKGYLLGPIDERTERGLAAIVTAVESGMTVNVNNTGNWLKPEELAELMHTSGTLDDDVSSSASELVKTSKYGKKDYIAGMIELAQATSVAINQRKELQNRHNRASTKIARWVQKKLN